MSASRALPNGLPRPRELLARLALATLAILALTYLFQRPLVRVVIPVISTAVRILDDEFITVSVDLTSDGGEDRLRYRANLARPVQIGGQTRYPFGWQGMPLGGFEVNLTVGSVVEYGSLMLILVAAWPAPSPRIWALRLGVCVPLLALLLIMNVAFTLVAELRHAYRADVPNAPLDPWLLWSRFLMDGGGAAIAIAFAALALAAGAWLERRISPGTRFAG